MTDFSFLRLDILRQEDIARMALDEAEKINAGKADLEDAKKALLKIAGGLARNALATAADATNALSRKF